MLCSAREENTNAGPACLPGLRAEEEGGAVGEQPREENCSSHGEGCGELPWGHPICSLHVHGVGLA